MTSVIGVSVIKQRSADPGVGYAALGSNSDPRSCRFIFCCPNFNAFLEPCVIQLYEPLIRSVARICRNDNNSQNNSNCLII